MNKSTPKSPPRACGFVGCEREHSAHGYCQSHNRQRRLGRELAPIQVQYKGVPLDVRFWARVDKSGECWIWTAHRNKLGYGRLDHGGKLHLAHRVAFALTNGPIPEGKIIDHMCHTPACVNPAHLRLTTPKQNGEHRKGLNKNNATGVRGVVWDKSRNKFMGQFKHHRMNISVGRFDTLEEAEAAVIARRAEVFTHEHSALTR